MKIIDKNQKIGKVLVVDILGKGTGSCRSLKVFKCLCDCGNEELLSYEQLTRNQTPACKTCARKLKFIDLTGRKFGRLMVCHNETRSPSTWGCKCKCGNTLIVNSGALLSGHSTSCGCKRKDTLTKNRISHVGERFGSLVIKSKSVNGHVKCQCDCGKIKKVFISSLYSGATKSCGCLRVNMMTGSNSRFWKGGITEIIRGIKKSPKYWKWVRHVKKRDAFTCQCCGKTDLSKNLHAHHIRNFADNIKIGFELDNGVTLCKNCHVKFHKTYGKIKNTRNQFNKFVLNERIYATKT